MAARICGGQGVGWRPGEGSAQVAPGGGRAAKAPPFRPSSTARASGRGRRAGAGPDSQHQLPVSPNRHPRSGRRAACRPLQRPRQSLHGGLPRRAGPVGRAAHPEVVVGHKFRVQQLRRDHAAVGGSWEAWRVSGLEGVGHRARGGGHAFLSGCRAAGGAHAMRPPASSPASAARRPNACIPPWMWNSAQTPQPAPGGGSQRARARPRTSRRPWLLSADL